jgi:hypothetical protein
LVRGRILTRVRSPAVGNLASESGGKGSIRWSSRTDGMSGVEGQGRARSRMASLGGRQANV